MSINRFTTAGSGFTTTGSGYHVWDGHRGVISIM